MTLHLDVLKGTNSWSAVLDDATHHRRVIYLRQPMLAAKLHLDRSLSPALGLVPGFNSLDGD